MRKFRVVHCKESIFLDHCQVSRSRNTSAETDAHKTYGHRDINPPVRPWRDRVPPPQSVHRKSPGFPSGPGRDSSYLYTPSLSSIVVDMGEHTSPAADGTSAPHHASPTAHQGASVPGMGGFMLQPSRISLSFVSLRLALFVQVEEGTPLTTHT